MRKTFSCYIIGETSLCIQCAAEVLKEGHKILGIVSPDNNAHQWALSNGIPYIASIQEFELFDASKTCDYLFSIVNSYILPSSIINLPRYYAINYHDAPLPKYAGVHATSWAILNNEGTHGVSWHLMEVVVDAGNMLKQVMFPLEENETALSLNLKCYIYALDTFKELIQALAQESILGVKQDLSNRSYFSSHQKPLNFGFLCWNSSAENINREYRAMTFGDYPNAFESFKILINQKIYIPTTLHILSTQSQCAPGTIVKITKNKIQLATTTHDIHLAGFRILSGKYYTIEDVVKETGITSGSQLNNISKKVLSLISFGYIPRRLRRNMA